MSEKPVRFRIIVPTKDRKDLLQRALRSVFEQTYKGYRVVVINDGSLDGTLSYLESIQDPRVRIIHFEMNRGVNVARNAGLSTLEEGEWVLQLDDDDELLPGALQMIANAIHSAPPEREVLHFQTVVRTSKGEVMGGYDFRPGEQWHDQTYYEVMTKARLLGDGRSAFRASLFSRYSYSEDVNGFESEFLMRLARDGVASRYLSIPIMMIDRSHDGEYLSVTAAQRSPAAFSRVHARIFREHVNFFELYPAVCMKRARASLSIAFRARSIYHIILFAWYWLRSSFRLVFRKGKENEQKR